MTMNTTRSSSAPHLALSSCSSPYQQKEHYHRATMSCSKESILGNAKHLNNKATDLIVEGDYQQGITTLSAALVQLKHAIRCSDDQNFAVTDASSSSSSSSMQGQSPLSFSHPTRSDLINEDEWYLYRHPVQITTLHGLDMAQCIEVISFAGIYNLGLCHHLQALKPDISTYHQQQGRLQRATSFYEHSQKLLSNNQDILDPDMIHSLVITNNLGHAHYHRGNESFGKLCFQQLLSAILYITADSQHGVDSNIVANADKDRWDGFMANIMQHLIGKTSHAAAA